MFNYTNANGDVRVGKIIAHAVIVVVGLMFLFGSMGTIANSERGVKVRFNKIVGTVEPGLYFKFPFVESVTRMPVNTRTVNYDQNGSEGDSRDSSSLSGASKDLQDVFIGVVVNWKVDPTKVENVYVEYHSVDNFQNNAIEPAIREVVKTASAQYTAEELVTKRAEYSDKVNAALTERLASKNAILEKLNITNFQFSSSFNKAIEEKVTAEQNALKAKNQLEQAKYEAEQRVAQAKGEAEAIKIQAQAITQQGGKDYVLLQWIQAWKETGGKVPQIVSNGNGFLMNLDSIGNELGR